MVVQLLYRHGENVAFSTWSFRLVRYQSSAPRVMGLPYMLPLHPETQKFRGELVKKLSKCKESFGGDLNKVENVCAEAQMDEPTMKLNEEGKQDCSGQNDVYGQVTKEPLGKIHCYNMSETRSSVGGAIIINLKTCLKTGRGRGRGRGRLRMKPWMLSSLENYVLFKLT